MGILSRFRDVMKANMSSLLDRAADDPEKVVDAYMRSLSSDLGAVKAETAAVLADESRAKRELDECNAEIKKWQRYAEKSVESGEDENAIKFLEKKAKQTEIGDELHAAYTRASAKATMMKQMQTKLVSDQARLEARYAELKGRMAAAQAQQQVNVSNAAASRANAALNAMEEQANQALNEALALAELRAGTPEDDLDALIAQLEHDANAGTAITATTPVEDELAAMKERLKSR